MYGAIQGLKLLSHVTLQNPCKDYNIRKNTN